MRKVLYKKWVKEYVENNVRIGGHWEEEFLNEGIFHQFGNAYEDFGEQIGNYTVALIEKSDGTIEEVLPINIKFVS